MGLIFNKNKGVEVGFTYQEAKDLLEFFGGDEETVVGVLQVTDGDQNHSGPGLYAYYPEYIDEGCSLLGVGRPIK